MAAVRKRKRNRERTGKMNQTIEKAAQWALQIAQDPSHGYDQIKRWGPDYDCSSFLISAWEQAGIKVKEAGATYTGNMRSAFLKCGFEDVTAEINLKTGVGLRMGDILLNEKHHTAMYIGSGRIVHASINERGVATGGKTGDQTGKEICTRSYYVYSKGWDRVLRYAKETQKTANRTEGKKMAQYAGIVNVSSYLNVRSGPGIAYNVVKIGGQDFRLPAGMVISIEAEQTGWGKLTGVEGWVSLEYIRK